MSIQTTIQRVATRYLRAKYEGKWEDLFTAPYPRELTRHLPPELDVVWWRNGVLHEGDIHDFIKPKDPEYENNPGYYVGNQQRVRADKVYLK